ncbi:MAG: hypothetical protein DWQ56_22370 [Microcystis aeruginosa DA14]|uniref:Uncharacterized protein n=1 Tax=Microcystis aeruginosa DA14 TaxID=1987506 RepID=A0A3E0M1J3_MICAE|nr:MAG: hypothetical protein DWQ56_22370 [Microcystis aeruginosa DA14]
MLKTFRHPPYQGGIPPPIGTPLIKGGSPRLSAPPLSRGDPPAYRHPPYQGGIPPPIGTPLIKGGSPRLSAPPLSRGAGGIYLQFNYNQLLIYITR